MVVKGRLTALGSGTWKYGSSKGGTTRVSALEIGGQSVHDVFVPDALKEYLQPGTEMALLILRTDLWHKKLCGVRVGDQSYRHGSGMQLALCVFCGAMLGWLVLPFILALAFLRKYINIETF